jgi:hypothetical protein
MIGFVQLKRLARLAFTTAASAGIVCLAACGVPPSEGDDIAPKTSALNVSTMQGLLDALNNNPNGSIVLTKDLVATNFNWHLGYFAGTLDGGTHSITNLTTSDTIGQAAGMFVYAEYATIKNLKLINLKVSGTYDVGGLVGDCSDCTIDSVSIEGALTAPNYVGGIAGSMSGGTIRNSYFKGTVTGGAWGAGGLVGLTSSSFNTGDYAYILNSYAQAANQTSTLVAGSTAAGIHPAGGIVGAGSSMWVQDVYAIGTVTGRGSAGGLVGQATCDNIKPWVMYRGIYRGNVTDANLGATPANWAGTVGKAVDVTCTARSSLLYFNNDLDKDKNFFTLNPLIQRSSSGAELTAPTAPDPTHGGIFCPKSMTLVPCGDDPITSPPWDFGTSSQNNVLMNVPGPNTQIR